MFEIVLWVLFGLLSGWIAALIIRTDNRLAVIAPLITGAIGAVTGGFINRIYGQHAETLQVTSLFSAIGGALVLLVLYEFVNTK